MLSANKAAHRLRASRSSIYSSLSRQKHGLLSPAASNAPGNGGVQVSHFNFGSDVSFGKRRPATSHILQSPAAPFDDPIRIEDLQAEPDILSEAVGPVENVKDEPYL